jgi:hypothetical protein
MTLYTAHTGSHSRSGSRQCAASGSDYGEWSSCTPENDLNLSTFLHKLPIASLKMEALPVVGRVNVPPQVQTTVSGVVALLK